MEYQERLDGADDVAGLVAVIRYLGSIRSHVARDGVDMRGGLARARRRTLRAQACCRAGHDHAAAAAASEAKGPAENASEAQAR